MKRKSATYKYKPEPKPTKDEIFEVIKKSLGYYEPPKKVTKADLADKTPVKRKKIQIPESSYQEGL